jgi:hypothetical protein
VCRRLLAGVQEEFVSLSLRRLATATSAALVALMLLGAGATTATVAGMEFQAGFNKTLPATVGPNQNAGYQFRIHNAGSSNVSQLVLSAPGNGAAAFVQNSRGTVCQKTPTLVCSFGSLSSDAYIDVTVAYLVGTSNFSVTFQLDSTGGAADKGHNSHGDSVMKTFSTSVNSGKNFAGGFDINGGGTFKTDDSLGKRNVQSTSAHSNVALTPIDVTDGILTFPVNTTNPCDSHTCVGDWAIVNVGGGTEGPVEVKILIYGQSIKGNPALNTFGLWHEGSSPNPIVLPCSDGSSIPSHGGDPAFAECVDVSIVGGNYLLDGWLKHNGTVRGLFG